MCARVLLFPTALAALLAGLLSPVDARAADSKTNASTVMDACGKDLQSGRGAFGCTRCSSSYGSKGGCIDYSCNYSGEGRQGCWRTEIFERKVRPRGRKGIGGVRVPVRREKSGGAVGGKGKGAAGARGIKPTGVGVRTGRTRDHRAKPVVRDHRAKPAVRDHRRLHLRNGSH